MIKKISILAAIIFAFNFSSANVTTNLTTRPVKLLNDKDIFGTRGFIENKGQFNTATDTKHKIFFAFENGEERIYFTNKGLIYKFIKGFPMTESQKEALEHGKKIVEKPSINYYLNMEWANANPNIEVVGGEKQDHYFTYGTKDLSSYVFKKITYKNVYNGIDIEYVIPKDHDKGIKYNVIVHPGANINDVKIVYSGDVKNIRLGKDGNVTVKSTLESITEHAPKSFYTNQQSVASNFSLNNDTISFQFPNNYDRSKTLVIDPWVANVTSMATNNYAYDVDYDYAGNLFIFGASGPFMIAKYSPAGALLWTFAGTVAVPAWTSLGSSPASKYMGNFVVNKFTGKCYTGQGFNSTTGAVIIRIDQNGVYDNFITTGVPSWQEAWEMGFHCGSGNVFGLGGSTASGQSAGIINQITAAMVPTSFTGLGTAGQDIACVTIDDLGNAFIIYASSFMAALNNNIARVNAAFTGTVWGQPSTYTGMNESANKQAYVGTGLSGWNSNAFNCLAVNGNYLFFYDGLDLAAYNKATGAKIGSILVPGMTKFAQGGIDVDDCNNVYIGGNNGNILSYNFTGTTFNALPSIALGVTTTNKYVYDIKLDKNANLLYVCGSGFTGVWSAINSLTCVNNQFKVTYNCMGNNNATGVASLTTTIGAPSINYTWANATGTISATTGTTATTNTVTNLANGIYTITIQINPPCGPIWIDTMLVNCVQTCSVAVSASTACMPAPTTSLNVLSTNGFTSTPSYTWTGPGAYTSNAQNNVFLNNNNFGTYTVTASNGGCSYTTTVTTLPISSFTPVITNTAVLCFGGSTGIANTTVNGGFAPFTYTWSSTPVQNNATASGLPVGIYTVSVTDNKNCIFTATTQITQPPVLNLAIVSNTPSICLGNAITSTGTATGGVTPYTYSWTAGPLSNINVTNETVAGSYTYTLGVTDANGCFKNATINLSYNPNPTVTVTSATVCAGDIAVLTASGANTYLWQPSNVVGPTYTVVGSTNLNLTVQGFAIGCVGTGTTSLLVNPLPVISISSNPLKGCVPLCLNLTSSTTNSIASYSWFLDSYGIGSSANTYWCIKDAGTYSVTTSVVDVNGCKNISSPLIVKAYPIPTADFNFTGDFSTDNPDVFFTDISFQDITGWYWYFGDGATSTLQNPIHPFTEANIYTTFLIATTSHGCSDTVSRQIKIIENPALYVPNSFTPNGDGFNDGFGAKGVAIKDFKLYIYDRWGEKLFETADIYKYWDGTIKGINAKEDTYVWLITYSTTKFKAKTMTGHVTLIR